MLDSVFHLLAEMIRDLKMWCKVESPCYQGSGSCAPGIILVNFVGADERRVMNGESLQLSNRV